MSRVFLDTWERGKLLPKQAELGRWGPGLQNSCEKTFLKTSEGRACPPPFPKVRVELPLSNLSGRDTGECSWGLDLQRNNSAEPCGKPRMAGGEGERERRAAGDTWKIPKASGWGKISLVTTRFVTDAEAISKSRGSFLQDQPGVWPSFQLMTDLCPRAV